MPKNGTSAPSLAMCAVVKNYAGHQTRCGQKLFCQQSKVFGRPPACQGLRYLDFWLSSLGFPCFSVASTWKSLNSE